MTNKRKIINDPVHGFITIPDDLIFDIIEHPYFQRLRRITQLGISYFVYPGAVHSRFNHSLGAMFLMQQAIEVLRAKGHSITDEECQAATIAILLHDIGHGPFSHSLENIFVPTVSHEDLSLCFLDRLNSIFNGKLSLAKEIFTNQYKKEFLHQLVSSQLDVDRLDYLARDSFFTGVSEGVIGTERIIKMLTVFNDELVVDEKGIYSIEKFIISRRLMYWQVYLHKTVIAADQLLIKTIHRARELIRKGENIECPPALRLFLAKDFSFEDFLQDKNLLEQFALLDDTDIVYSLKRWAVAKDKILSTLSGNLLNRNLPKIILQNKAFEKEDIEEIKNRIKHEYKIEDHEMHYFVFTGNVQNNAYSFQEADKINILRKNGECVEFSKASDQLDTNFLAKSVNKYFLCFPKIKKMPELC